jgi:hypothetical protein
MNAKPKRYSGPTLGGENEDTSIEELVLSVEYIDVSPKRQWQIPVVVEFEPARQDRWLWRQE